MGKRYCFFVRTINNGNAGRALSCKNAAKLLGNSTSTKDNVTSTLRSSPDCSDLISNALIQAERISVVSNQLLPLLDDDVDCAQVCWSYFIQVGDYCFLEPDS